jgi:cytochrome P450
VHAETPQFDYPSTAQVECPYPTLSQIRAAGSVHRIGESNRYLVSHYDDVEYVLKTPELFSNTSEERIQPFDWPGPEGVPPESLGPRTGRVLNVIELDPPHHKRRRDRMFQVLRPARVRAYRPWIEETVDDLIDAFASDGHADLLPAFAFPLPTRMIIRILGLSDDDFPWLHAWGLVEWRGGAQYLSEEARQAQRPFAEEAGERVTAAILERVEEPRDDGLSELIGAQIEADGDFNLGMVRADLGQFVRAGITTTGHLISNTLLLMLDHEADMRRAAEDPAAMRALLEEVLRLEAPLQWIPRIARQDVTLGGVDVPAGAYLIVMLASANRDEAKWGETAGAFCPERANAIDHLGFGKGAHFCIGAPLGRLEAQIALTRLLARLKNIRLAPGSEPRHLPSPTLRGLAKLEVEFDPA